MCNGNGSGIALRRIVRHGVQVSVPEESLPTWRMRPSCPRRSHNEKHNRCITMHALSSDHNSSFLDYKLTLTSKQNPRNTKTSTGTDSGKDLATPSPKRRTQTNKRRSGVHRGDDCANETSKVRQPTTSDLPTWILDLNREKKTWHHVRCMPPKVLINQLVREIKIHPEESGRAIGCKSGQY